MRTSCMHNYAAWLYQPHVNSELSVTDISSILDTPYGAAFCIDAPETIPAGSMHNYEGEYYRGPLQTGSRRTP